MAEDHNLPPALRANLQACICELVTRGNAFTDRALDYYAEHGALCLTLTIAGGELAHAEVADTIRESFERHTTRWRSKGHHVKGGIGRTSFRRARAGSRTRENGCMSCGSKRACRKHTIQRAEFIAWVEKNCGGGKARKKGEPVGGNLPAARRAAGLWDPAQPIDENARPGQAPPPHIAEGPNRDFAASWAATANQQQAADGALASVNARDWGAASKLGYSPCQTPGSGMSCFDPGTGLERRWTVVGRHFTPAERAEFQRRQCTPTCDFVPISAGAPADAKTGVRRIAPRNPAVRPRVNCRSGAGAPAVSPLSLRPLPPLAAQPGAQAVPKVCRPDTVIGVDGGMFGSGWWIIIRDGQRLLVPNPELCGGPPPQF